MLGQQLHEKDQTDLTSRGSELPTSSLASPPPPNTHTQQNLQGAKCPHAGHPILGPTGSTRPSYVLLVLANSPPGSKG